MERPFKIITALMLMVLFHTPHPASAQYYHVSGYVTDPNGSGIWNVDLDVTDSNTGDPLNISGDHTDPNGYYDIILPTGTFDIEYNAPPGVKLVSEIRRNVVVQSNMVIDVSFEEGYYLSGRVTDDQGIGVAQVDIDVDDSDTGLRIVTPRDDTNGNGDYQVVVPAGIFDVTFEPPPGVRLVGSIFYGIEITGDTALNTSLEEGYFVSGWVVDEGGGALPDIDLDVEDVESGEFIPTPRDNTDNNGYFLVVMPAGMFSVTFDPLMREDLAASRLDTVVVTSDTVLDTVTLLNGVILSGTVTDSRGTPVVDADLDVIEPSTLRTIPTPRDNTDESGHYAVTIPPAVYDLNMSPPPGSGLTKKSMSSVSVLNDTVVDFVLGDATGIEEDEEKGQGIMPPRGLSLSQNYPNPFNPSTSIRFVIPDDQFSREDARSKTVSVILEVFDLRGRRVKELVNEPLEPGSHSITWDGRDGKGRAVVSGVYFLRLSYGPYSILRKMTGLK